MAGVKGDGPDISLHRVVRLRLSDLARGAHDGADFDRNIGDFSGHVGVFIGPRLDLENGAGKRLENAP